MLCYYVYKIEQNKLTLFKKYSHARNMKPNHFDYKDTFLILKKLRSSAKHFARIITFPLSEVIWFRILNMFLNFLENIPLFWFFVWTYGEFQKKSPVIVKKRQCFGYTSNDDRSKIHLILLLRILYHYTMYLFSLCIWQSSCFD